MSSRLTPMDIEQQEFSRRMRGYDLDEVRMFLRSVAEEIERVNLENGRMLEENGRLRSELEELRSRDRILQQTLVSAQRMAEEMKDRARSECELVVKEARLNVDQKLRAAQEELSRIEAEVDRVKLERDTFEVRLRNVIDQHLTMLDLRREAHGEFDNVRVLPRRVGSDG